MEEALEQACGLFVADAEAAEVLEPRDRAFHLPASDVASERTAILRRGFAPSVDTVRCDQFDALLAQVVAEAVAVVGLVADDSLGRRLVGRKLL